MGDFYKDAGIIISYCYNKQAPAPLQRDEPAAGGPARRLLAALFDSGGSVAGLERARRDDPANRAAMAGLDPAVLRRWTGEDPPLATGGSGEGGGCRGGCVERWLPGTTDPQVVPVVWICICMCLLTDALMYQYL